MVDARGPSIRTVLVAEPDAVLREAYLAEARRSGFVAVAASGAEETWRLCGEAAPDALIVDAELADAGGPTCLLRRLRADPLGAVLPIILLSVGRRELRSASDALLRHDVEEFFEKPVYGEHLFWRLRELIEGRPLSLPAGSSPPQGQPPRSERSFQRVPLGQRGAVDLFFAFFADARSGRLVATQGEEVLQVDFRRGTPVAAESSRPELELGTWLLQRAGLAPGPVAEARAEWQRHDRDLGVLMVARGLLGARRLLDERRQRADAVISRLISLTEGEVFVEFDQASTAALPASSLSLHRKPADYVLDGIEKHYSAERCRRLLRAGQGEIRPARGVHFILRELREPYRFENVVARLGPSRGIEELLASPPFDGDSAELRYLAGLRAIGAVLGCSEQDLEAEEGALEIEAGPWEGG